MVIQPGIKHSFIVERPLHISKAVIDFRSIPTRSSFFSAVTSLLVDMGDNKEIILCNLYMTRPDGYMNKNYKILKPEADLDLHFKAGQKITFFSAKHFASESSNTAYSQAVIHLSGYQL